MKFWICVVSKEHALKGIEGEFIQACHGKSTPLKRMQMGDYVTFYCPKITFLGKEKYQHFLGIGQVLNNQVYQYAMTDDFKPYRMNIKYLKNSSMMKAPISELINNLTFIKDKTHWGYMFRFGHFEIPKIDFDIIINAMNVAEYI